MRYKGVTRCGDPIRVSAPLISHILSFTVPIVGSSDTTVASVLLLPPLFLDPHSLYAPSA